MITVISGTNRSGSLTLTYAKQFMDELRAQGAGCQLLDLSTLQLDLLTPDMYDAANMGAELRSLQETYILGAKKLVVLVPEYNGSYPGVLKLFIDAISINEYGRNFKGKVAALIGISSGRAGNLRGLDHLADTLAHMGAWVLPNRLPVSLADAHLTGGAITDEATLANLKAHAEQLIAA